MASKLLKDLALKVLNNQITNEKTRARVLERYPNLEKEQITEGLMFLLNITQIIHDDTLKASERLKAYQILEATAGQKPIDKQEITNIDNKGFLKVVVDGIDISEDEDIFAGDYINEDWF